MKVNIITKEFKDINKGDNVIIKRTGDYYEDYKVHRLIGIVIGSDVSILHKHRYIKVITQISYGGWIVKRYYEHDFESMEIKVVVLK